MILTNNLIPIRYHVQTFQIRARTCIVDAQNAFIGHIDARSTKEVWLDELR